MAKKKTNGDDAASLLPSRRMTQTELDSFLEKAADLLRGNVDHSEFRRYVFALLFFKRISDLFEESVRKLEQELGPELAHDPAMQKKTLPFVVPKDCLWETVTNVVSTKLGKSLNETMIAIEKANHPKFDGILTDKINFAKEDELPRDKLVELKNHFSKKTFSRAYVPDDLFGDAYEYLIRTFASKAGKSSGEFYTPKEVSYLMSEIIEPAEQHEVCDWASGSGSLLLQCREYLTRHGKDPNQLFLFSQESNLSTYNISRINLILHGVNSWKPKHGDSLRTPKHEEGKRIKTFDRIVMNPPFSLKSWGADKFTDGDPYDRFPIMPPADNGDYAWMQHVVKSLKPDGKAIIVMSQGILFRGQPELTEAEDGRNKKADDEYLIRSGFVKDDLIEAIIVLPSGIFYGNNVPACLAIINKRKPKARKKKVLMIWASRDYQHANPQCLLRRADCLRILLPWRAYGDPAVALKMLPKEGQAFLDEINADRQHSLDEISEAYDPVIAELPTLETEVADLSADGFKAWQKTRDAKHPVWGLLADPAKVVDDLSAQIKALPRGDASKPKLQKKLKAAKKSLSEVTKNQKKVAKDRSKLLKAKIRLIEKLEKERDERILGVNQRAERETAEVNEAIKSLETICGDPEHTRRYFVVADFAEMQENEFNLNLPRFVNTFEPEEEIDLGEAMRSLEEAKQASDEAQKRLRELLPSGVLSDA
ncbi:type I restriction-modification system subunit M [Rosistilla oblonga]|uniref:type I restriction-modification system subunit M n=1 Tax=Rosistilla oblonga TaxID=2527990 RepID=UPI003A9875C5